MRKFIYAGLLWGIGIAQEPLIKSDIKQLLTKKQQAVLEEKEELYRQSQIKITTLFYFASESMGADSIKVFNENITRIKNKGYDIQGMVILRGFPKDFRKYVFSIYDKNQEGVIKVHPLFFRQYKIKEVPAYILAQCYTPPNFSRKTCDSEYLIRGDIALSDFLRRISNEDKKYLNLYYALIGTTADKTFKKDVQ